MRIGAAVHVCTLTLLTLFSGACGGGGLFRQYEYEEEMYIALDGSATVYVNSSLAALNALRGSSFDTSPNAPVDRDAVRAFFSSPVTEVVGRMSTSRRSGRRFVHVRVDVPDIRRLTEAPAFSWSTYSFVQDDDLFIFRQKVNGSPGKPLGEGRWTGEELAAFRLHVPSRVVYHNAGEPNLRRGNILVWEQLLADRLKAEPLELEARMQSQSILYRTLYLFAGTFVAVVFGFVVVVWLVVRRGRKARRAGPSGPAVKPVS